MKSILAVAYYTLIENIRNKIFYVLLLFGIILIAAALLVSALGGEQPVRIILDLGLATIEFFALITIVFSSVTLILEEIESKTIYLILTRPVSRGLYLIGRFVGLLAAIYAGILIMSFLHIGILVLNGWVFTFKYPLALMLSMEKITIIGSVALLFSLISTSPVSSISFTVSFWVLGHFSEELRFLGSKATFITTKILAKMTYYLAPNMQYFNLKDFWDVPGITGQWILSSVAYGFIYSAICLVFSIWILRNKEF